MKKRMTLALTLTVLAVLLIGCVHYVPRGERGEETTAQTTAATTSAQMTEATTAKQTTAPLTSAAPQVTDAFPNEAEDGQTKRY